MIGQLDANVLEALLETLPVEFSIVNHDDKMLAWNKHETGIFKRPKGILGRDVKDCHPKGSLDKVEKILSEMKSGKRDKAEFWIDLKINGDGNVQKILIAYYALRDTAG
jgi:DUF438 domain-containing protein